VDATLRSCSRTRLDVIAAARELTAAAEYLAKTDEASLAAAAVSITFDIVYVRSILDKIMPLLSGVTDEARTSR
jgi:hypothetical protein